MPSIFDEKTSQMITVDWRTKKALMFSKAN